MKDYLIRELNLPEELADFFILNSNQKRKDADTLILEEGKKSDHLYFIQKGVVAAFTLSDKGKENMILFFEENHFFGGSIQPGLNNTISFKTIIETVLYEFSHSQFSKLMIQEPKIQQVFQDNLNSTHKIIQRRISTHISLNAKERYIEFLKDYPGMINRIPHYYVASYLGITSTQLSRIRKKILRD